MSRKTNQKPRDGRTVVAVDPDLNSALEAVRTKVGSPSVSFLTRLALRYMVRRINAGELAVVNGELKPTGSN